MNLEANRVVDGWTEPAVRYVYAPQEGMSATLHVRKLACPCGHVFPGKAQQTKRKRPIESRQSDNVRKAAKRACEIDEETRKRQTHNKECMASIRQCETREQTTKRQAQHQQHMFKAREPGTIADHTACPNASINFLHCHFVIVCAVGKGDSTEAM